MTDDTGRVITVRGPIDPGDLGRTMPHEHLFFSASGYWKRPDGVSEADAHAPLGLDNLWQVRRQPGASRTNKHLDDFDALRGELAHFLADGGRTIVDVTTRGIGPDPVGMRRISEATGVQVVAGTGYYMATVRPPDFRDRSVEDIAAELARDIQVGFEGTDIRAGIIGELAIEGSGPRWGVRHVGELDPGDVTLLQAAARTQARTGAAIYIHPPETVIRGVPATMAMHGVLDLLADAGADLSRVVMGHLERDPWETVETLSSLGARGVFLGLDEWGYEGYALESKPTPWLYPSDHDRVRLVKGLIANGFADRILLSQDVCDKLQWRKFGGTGYSHIISTIAPVLLGEHVSQGTIDQILIANPARLLTLDAPRSIA